MLPAHTYIYHLENTPCMIDKNLTRIQMPVYLETQPCDVHCFSDVNAEDEHAGPWYSQLSSGDHFTHTGSVTYASA